MDFEQFAESHGLIIDYIIRDRWVRVPTTDHPRSRNGAYIFDGLSGAVQNWAVHEKPITWRSEKIYIPNKLLEIKKARAKQEQEDQRSQALRKASWIMHNGVTSTHPYLASKGFEYETGYVWNKLLIIPMRVENRLVGCQMINHSGKKNFLKGQLTKGASTIFENKGVPILVEGYATALSVRLAMKTLGMRYKIVVCFSAANMVEMSKVFPGAVVIADNDEVGIKTAQKITDKFWLSPCADEDFNDYHQRLGIEKASESLAEFIHTPQEPE